MAADGSAPWSRWDPPGFQYVTTNTQPTIQRYFDSNGNLIGAIPSRIVKRDTSQFFARSQLLDVRINSLDPSFYDCVYSTPSAVRVIEQCYKDIGCCESGCCPNDTWADEYGWAVALIVIFCILVLIAVLTILCCWLRNRSRDKHQKCDLLDTAGFYTVPAQISPVTPPTVRKTEYGGGYQY